MPNTKRSSKVKDRDWSFLAKLLELADAEDEEILKCLPHRPCWSSVPGGFELSVKASIKHLAAFTGLEESEVKSAIKRLTHNWKWLKPFGPTQGKRIREFSLLLPSQNPESIKALFDKKWEQLNTDEARMPLSPTVLHQMALERLVQEQRWLSISRLLAHQGTEKTLDNAGFVAPFLVEFQGEQEISLGKMTVERRDRLGQQQNFPATPLPYQSFLEQVVRGKQSKKSDGRRIAIIGEPGAGKSTLLQHTALWLAKELEYLPVWISLSHLCQGAVSLHNLEAYILNDWLSVLLPNADPDTQKLFRQMCIEGKVCLLIDGIDEVSIKDTNEAVLLERQLKSSPLLSRMIVVVTCRTDYWNSFRNSLRLEFDTYQLLDLFDHRFPGFNQIDQFILRWFRLDPNLGRSLIKELNKPRNLEVKELMSNRLCLALLCHRWSKGFHQKEISSRRVELYERYVDDFFSWKPELVIPPLSRKRMKQALGELAYRAFVQEVTPFQLSSRLVEQIWEKRDLPEEWLEMLQDIGILYPIQILDDGIDKTAYTFLHPVFQEYFAAQFIDNSKLLFNPNYQDPKDAHANYYALELRWRRILFLWLSRDDILDIEKDTLLKALISVENVCGGFYYYRAYFLAAEGLREFKRSCYASEILQQVIRWSFRQFNQLPEVSWLVYYLVDEAMRVLRKTDSHHVVSVLKDFFSQSDPYLQCEIALELGMFEQGRQFAIKELEHLIRSSDSSLQFSALSSLSQIESDNPNIIQVLPLLLDPNHNESTRLHAASWLKDLDSSHRSAAIEVIYQLSEEAVDNDVRKEAQLEIFEVEGFSGLSDSLNLESVKESRNGSLSSLLPSLGDVLEQLSCYTPGSDQFKATIEALFNLLSETDSFINLIVDRDIAIQVIRTLKQQSIDSDTFSIEQLKAIPLLQRCAEIVPFYVFHEAWHFDDV